MKLTVRGSFRFARKGVTRMVWFDSSRSRTAAYARIRYADWPSIGSTAAPGRIEAVCFSGAVWTSGSGAPLRTTG